MKHDFIFPFIAPVLGALYFIGSEAFIRYFGDYSLFMAVIITLSGGIFLLLFVKDRKASLRNISNKDMFLLFVASIFSCGISYLFLYRSINLIGSSKCSFLSQIEPVFIFILSILFLKERFNLKEVVGLFTILGGVLLLNFDISLIYLSIGAGDIYAVLSALMFAIGIIIISKLLRKYNALLITSLEMIIGGLVLSPFLLISQLNFEIILIFSLIIIGCILSLTWLTYNLGLKKFGTSKTAIIYSTKSFFVLLISYLLVKYVPLSDMKIPINLASLIVGGIIITAGMIILQMNKPRSNVLK
ncbi:MAG: DMT family transporter [Nanoarchaeota archaeon]|nr:DMT family transporter [Nanoarchaeota archaeon]